MKNLPLLTLIGLLCSTGSFTQNLSFELANPQPNLIEVYGGSFASGDIDGDGDNDLFMSGLNPGRDTALYLNDGTGDFAEVTNTPFPNASSTLSFFEDLDGDGDLDLYFSGIGFSIGEFAHIYLNDGDGVFTQLANPSLPQFQGGAAALGDLDNDTDLDIIISTEDGNGTLVADIFLNDGNANFSPMGSTSINPLKFGSLALLDAENDGDLDVIISGENQSGIYETALYLNDGTADYSLDTQSSFMHLGANDIDTADIDNDGDMDILMSGMDNAADVFTLLYLNDGNGEFSLLNDTGIQDTFAGVNAFADLDNDGDLDLLTTGSQQGGLPNIFNIVYENLGGNQFVESATLGGEYISACIADDFNGDGLKDIIIMGFVDDTNAYWNTTEVLGIEENTIDSQQLTVFPNPVSHRVTVSSSENLNKLTVYDILGRTLMSSEESKKEIFIDMSSWSSGTYFLKIESLKWIITKKVLKY